MTARITATALLCATLLCAPGCVTEIVKPATSVDLFSTRAGDKVALSWKTKPGETYAIQYASQLSGGGKWTVLPGADRILGTGRVHEMVDQVPGGQQRYYRIIVVPAK